MYKKGRELADALSRAYPKDRDASEATEDSEELEVLSILPVSDAQHKKLIQATAEDPTCQKIAQMTATGWPKNAKECCEELKSLHPMRDELFATKGVILRGQRIYVPRSLRAEYLNKVHGGHLGAESTKRRAMETMFWPKMSNDIKHIEACTLCNSTSHQRKEPLMPYPVPAMPWSTIALDLFEW